MEILPTLRALRKHKLPAALIVLEVTLAVAVFCNALSMIAQHVDALNVPNAIDQNGIVDIHVSGTNPELARIDLPRDVTALRQIPGVLAATVIEGVPLSNRGMVIGSATTKRNQLSGGTTYGLYAFAREGPSALGLHLLRGRLFNHDEYADAPRYDGGYLHGHEGEVPVVVTRSFANHLWPGQTALGKGFFVGGVGRHDRVIGVVGNVLLSSDNVGRASFANAVFTPVRAGPGMHDYILRTRPQDRQAVLHAAVAKLRALSPDAVVKGQTFNEIRSKYFAATRNLVWILALVCVLMLAVTACSIGGLSSFWVSQRRHQIGIRRALGATRGSILRHFQVENFVLGSAGVVLGLILAYGANLYLMAHYQVGRMPWYYLPISAVAVWIVGQLAVLGPALHAAAVPPAVATRSV